MLATGRVEQRAEDLSGPRVEREGVGTEDMDDEEGVIWLCEGVGVEELEERERTEQASDVQVNVTCSSLVSI